MTSKRPAVSWLVMLWTAPGVLKNLDKARPKNTMRFMPTRTSITASQIRSLICVALCSLLVACASSGAVKSNKPKSSSELERAEKAMVHTKLARGYLEQKQYATAKTELERALRIYPNHSDSNYVMALLMIRLEQYQEAEVYYERAVRNDPENSSAAHDFGVFLCQLGKERRAIDYFEIAVSNPLFKRAELSYMRAGECLANIGDAGAEQYLKKSLSINPRLRPALYRLAVVKYEAGSYLSARAYIERYFAITNPQPAALLLAYKIESNLNAMDVAESYRSKLLREFPGSEEAASLRPSRD